MLGRWAGLTSFSAHAAGFESNKHRDHWHVSGDPLFYIWSAASYWMRPMCRHARGYLRPKINCLIDVFRLLFHISSAWSNWFKTHDCHLIYAGAKRSNIQWRWPFRQFSSFSPPSLTGKCSDLSFQCGYINSEVLIYLYTPNRFPVDSVYAHCGSDWALCYLWHWYKNPFRWFNTLSEIVENECDHIAFVNTNLTWCVLTCQSTTALKQGF